MALTLSKRCPSTVVPISSVATAVFFSLDLEFLFYVGFLLKTCFFLTLVKF